MRPGQQNKQRMRGRGRKGANPLSRSYESNGPDVKIRGNAQHIAEKYIQLARDATASGDRVMAENYLQHAEHYGRIVAAAQGTFQLQREEPDGFDGDYEDGDEDGVGETGGANGHPYPVPERGERQPAFQPGHPGQNREQGARDNGQGVRDNGGNGYGNRDNANRDNRGDNNRERGGEQRFNRDERRDRRDFNRDRRENRFNGEERRPFEGRERPSGERGFERGERQAPAGLGPQPVIGEMPPRAEAEAPQFEARALPRDEAPVAVPEAVPAAPAAASQESGFGAAEASAAALAEPEGAILPSPGDDGAHRDADAAGGEPRRRGRPRRPRFEADATGESAAAASPDAPSVAAEGEEPQAKRRPGRPRKKKPEDEAGEADANRLPDFLLASNG